MPYWLECGDCHKWRRVDGGEGCEVGDGGVVGVAFICGSSLNKVSIFDNTQTRQC